LREREREKEKENDNREADEGYLEGSVGIKTVGAGYPKLPSDPNVNTLKWTLLTQSIQLKATLMEFGVGV